MKKLQRGYSVVETSIVLAIVAIVLIGAVIGVNSILQRNTINKTISETKTAVVTIKRKYIKESDYSGIHLQILTSASNNIWPSAEIDQAGMPFATVKNSLGAWVLVFPLKSDYLSMAKNSAFVYTLTNVPLFACVDLVLGLESLADVITVKNLGSARDRELTRVVVATDVVKNLNEEVSVNKVSDACGSGALARISLIISRDGAGS